MPLLLLDLDNTLIPRDAAFRAWATDFLHEHGLPATELSWLTTIDGSGYVPRSTVLSAVQRRYGLDLPPEDLVAHYRRGVNSHIHCPTSHVAALRAARAAGWTLVVVTNGGTGPQMEKMRLSGLHALVDAWVVSEEVGCEKPDPLIFDIAAQRCGVEPDSGWQAEAWMVGDHGPADIAGAQLAGIRSIWLDRGRPWSELGYRPTLSTPDLPGAIELILAEPATRPADGSAATDPTAQECRTADSAPDRVRRPSAFHV
ncbi:HAD family hydrolase [Kitasatospora sp. NPDC058965]|uniref:HAD family hydrolase n=1 Tax=Kitasatospora sp. NPDC058965 TaxID=3346682 RepID=UPI0036C049F3